MKYLKFRDELVDLILSGRKWTTWRVNDEKGITVDDKVSLCYNNGNEFARAKIYSVRETLFGKLTEEDKEGHESYSSDEQMYKQFTEDYKIKVTPQTKVKVIKFTLM